MNEACDLIEPMLRRSVIEHLESDVPIAAFLSGGIDSSLVASQAAMASARPIRAFAIGFGEPRFDESPYARKTAERIGLDIHVEILGEDGCRAQLDEAMRAYDEPFGDSSSLATYLLSRVVGSSHSSSRGRRRRRGVCRLPQAPHPRAPRGAPSRSASEGPRRAGLARAPLPHRQDERLYRCPSARRVSRSLSGDDAHAFVALSQVGSLDKTAPVVVRPANPELFWKGRCCGCSRRGRSELQRTLTCDLANALPNDMLTKVDRASMACHLEVRTVSRSPPCRGGGRTATRIHGEGTRQAESFGPSTSANSVERWRIGKMGSSAPVEAWMRGPLEGECERVFSKERLDRLDVLSSAALGEGRWKAWREKDPQILWHAFALASWCEYNLG